TIFSRDWSSDVCSSDLVSATPAQWELDQTGGVFTEQVIRPTGLLDPVIEIRPVDSQVDDLMDEARRMAALGRRVLVTTLTKRMRSEERRVGKECGTSNC